MTNARDNPENPLVKVVLHFQDGATAGIYLDKKPVPQWKAFYALGQLTVLLGVESFAGTFGFGMDTPVEKWEVTP